LNEIESVIASFQGEILQTPPMFSAKKIDGKKLYELARQGIEIERPAQKVQVNISIIEYSYPFLTIDVSCSKGTYIRSLAQDIGQTLKTGAYLEKLVRLRSGNFWLEDCIDYSLLSVPSFNYKHHLQKLPSEIAHSL
jgi:tRNA pseudouridine55 synthase